MDPALGQYIEDTYPEFNMQLARGFATTQIPLAERYVDMLFNAISKSFPKELKYVEGRRCTPMEEYREATKKRNQKTVRKNPKSTYDIAVSNVYMMRYQFSYRGVLMKPRYLYLPYVTEAGHIMISGGRFTVSPVLADRVISILEKSIFIRLNKSKLVFYRLNQHFLVDGVDNSVYAIWARVYQKQIQVDSSNPNRITNGRTTMAHYLFCKYGIVETFKQFANCAPVIGDDKTITYENYPKSKWHITSSVTVFSQKPPKGRSGNFYTPSNIRVAIKKEEFSNVAKSLLAGFYYVLDFFPEQIKPEYLGRNSETRMWLTLLGYLTAPGTQNIGKLIREMEEHFRSLDEYIDIVIKTQLNKIGIFVDNIYQLFGLLIMNFNKMLLSGSENLSSMYNKEPNVNYFVLFDISRAIVELGFRMMKLSSKEDLAEKEIDSAFNSLLRTGIIYKINNTVGSVSTTSYPGDNMALKITTILVPQQSSNRKSKSREPAQIDDPINRLHVSIAEVGGYANLPKSAPSGHARINHYALMDKDNVLIPDPQFAELYAKAQVMFDQE